MLFFSEDFVVEREVIVWVEIKGFEFLLILTIDLKFQFQISKGMHEEEMEEFL